MNQTDGRLRLIEHIRDEQRASLAESVKGHTIWFLGESNARVSLFVTRWLFGLDEALIPRRAQLQLCGSRSTRTDCIVAISELHAQAGFRWNPTISDGTLATALAGMSEHTPIKAGDLVSVMDGMSQISEDAWLERVQVEAPAAADALAGALRAGVRVHWRTRSDACGEPVGPAVNLTQAEFNHRVRESNRITATAMRERGVPVLQTDEYLSKWCEKASSTVCSSVCSMNEDWVHLGPITAVQLVAHELRWAARGHKSDAPKFNR